MKIFSKQKMLERLEREGRTQQITPGALEIMDALDGREAIKNNYKALVFGQLEFMVSYEGNYYPVNPNDCIEQ